MGNALSGVYSGIDTSTIVSQLMAIEGRSITALDSRQAKWEAKSSSLTGFESRLQVLSDLAEDIKDMANLRSVTTSSSDKDIVAVSTSAGATEGSHEVIVNRLATTERLVHDAGLAELTTLVGEGAFVYTYNSTTRNLQTTDETTIDDLRGLINNDGANPGVTASILEHGGTYHLVLAGNDSGSDYGITIDDALTTIAGFDTADFLETQTAQDSQIRVDGYPAAEWIERSTNSITDVIPSVTLNIYSTGTATVTMARNTGGITTNVNNLVKIYNGIVDQLTKLTGYDEDTETGGIFQGDSTLKMVVSQLRTVLGSAVSGFVDGTDSFTLPAQLGLEFDSEGKLELDSEVLDEAITEDYLGVLKLISAAGSGASDSNYIQFTSSLASTDPGTYEVEVSFDGSGNISQARIRTTGETWHDADYDGNIITGQSGYPEAGLQLTWAWDVSLSSPETAEVTVQQGMAGRLYDRLEEILDETDGTMKQKKDQIDNSIKQIKKNIERMEKRLEIKRKYLEQRYARLEATLARLDSQTGAFNAMFQSLATYSNNN